MRIAAVVIPRFPLALELCAQPHLRGRPVALGGSPEEAKVVVECSPEAERAGIRRGMPLREAQARCRELEFLAAHPAIYAATFERMLDALEQVSPIVEGEALGRALVDLTGLPGAGTASGEMELAGALRRATKAAVGLTPRAGIADSRFAAWVAAVSPARAAGAGGPRSGAPATDGQIRIVPPGEASAFLEAAPVHRLPLSGEMLARLRWLGLRTIGDLAALPRTALAAQFGPEGALAWDIAHGEGGEVVVPRTHRPDIADCIEFPQPSVETAAILVAARHLLHRLLRRPECAGRAVRGMTVDARLSNGHQWQRDITFREPTANQERIMRVLAARLDNAAFPAAVESLTLRLHEPCGETGIQAGMFSNHARLLHSLDGPLEQLRARFGRHLVMKIVGVEPWSRIPERQYALIAYEPSTALSL